MGFSSSLYNNVHVALLLFLFLFFKFSWCSNEVLRASCKPAEREALLVFKGSLTDPSNRLSSWTGRDCCSWDGVQCDSVTGHVVMLDLGDYNDSGSNETWLVGSEVSSALAKLEKLEYLDLSYNNFAESKIPDFFGNFKSLRSLLLSHASFAGVVPQSLGNLSALQDLFLNGLDHLILDSSPWLSRLASLEYLDISAMNLSQVPDAIQNLTNLVSLYMSDNHLSGHIPDWLSQLKNLKSLNLDYNTFSGSIPSFFCSLPNLRFLGLGPNQLSGSIPACLGNLSNLYWLILESNLLKGTLPESLGQLSNLRQLEVNNNFLSGVVSEIHFEKSSKLKSLYMGSNSLVFNMSGNWSPPFQLDSLYLESCQLGQGFLLGLRTQTTLREINIRNAVISVDFKDYVVHAHFSSTLRNLDASNTSISGRIPENFVTAMPNLMFLFLSNNNINGSIPTSLCEIKSLQAIDLSNNHISGELPRTCWNNSKDMELINLASNNLTGHIPSSIAHMPFLKALHLSKNEFYGELPQTMKNCKNLVVLDLAGNKYSGSLSSWIGSLSSLEIFNLRSNKFGGSLIPELCHLYNLHILDLAYNNFSSFIPLCFGNFTSMKRGGSMGLYNISGYDEKLMQVMKGRELEYTTNLKLLANLDLSYNNLVGGIPVEITLLHGLTGLHLSNNQLTGEIPKMIGDLKSLDSLDFSNNRLSGSIPESISALGTLSYLNISFNNLSGQIPSGHLQSFDASNFVGNPHLYGIPLDNVCSPQTLSQIPGNTHKVEDENEEDIGFYVSAIVGSIVGFWGFWGVLWFKKTWRFTYFRLVESTIGVVLSSASCLKK